MLSRMRVVRMSQVPRCNSTLAKVIHTRTFVGRRIQARAARHRHRRNLQGHLIRNIEPHVIWQDIPSQETICIVIPAIFAPSFLVQTRRPLPWPQIKCNDCDRRFQTIRQGPCRAEPLPGTGCGQGQLYISRQRHIIAHQHSHINIPPSKLHE